MTLRATAWTVLLLVPALAGCTWFGAPPGGEGIDPRVVREAYVVPALQLHADHSFANVRVSGPVLAVPVGDGAQETGAVFFGANVTWRADAIFQVREGDAARGNLFVQPPAGSFPDVRAQGWTTASNADLSSGGFASPEELFLRASRLLPANVTAPAPGTWVVNGTVVARFFPANVSLVVESGPFVFQRNATGFTLVENRTILNWQERTRTLSGSNDALIEAVVKDSDLASLEVSWTRTSVSVRIQTPRFRETELKVDQDTGLRTLKAELEGVASVAMVRLVSQSVEDDRVELRSANMTVVMAP